MDYIFYLLYKVIVATMKSVSLKINPHKEQLSCETENYMRYGSL